MRRDWKGPIGGTVLAAVLGVAATLAVLRPWEERPYKAGTPATASTLEAEGSTLRVQIDSLVRQGGTVRLQWTVKNIGNGNAPLVGKLGGGALDLTVSKVNLIPPGVAMPIYPAWKNGACQCTEIPAAPFDGGDQIRLSAIFENVPQDVNHVDVDLFKLGLTRNVQINEE